jgi:hypothetical protein
MSCRRALVPLLALALATPLLAPQPAPAQTVYAAQHTRQPSVGIFDELGTLGAGPDRSGRGAGRGAVRRPGRGDSAADSAYAGPGSPDALTLPNQICASAPSGRAGRNCRGLGEPESSYPISNYGFDINADTGVDNIIGNMQQALGELANALWLGALYLLHGIFTLLGWALSLNPFADDGFLGDLGRRLESLYDLFTEPVLVVAFVALGSWVLWRGLVRREGGPAVAGTLAAVGLMLVGWVVIHEPRETVGRASELGNDLSLGLIGASQGLPEAPAQGYAAATEEAWRGAVYPLFATLNFSNPRWAQEPVLHSNETIAEVLGERCEDAASAACTAGEPRQNLEVWLAFARGSDERKQLWDDLTDEPFRDLYDDPLHIQAGESQAGRLPLVLLLLAGLLGLIFLLAWLALRIFLAAGVAFLTVLMAPIVILFPAFGESGRKAFTAWGTTMLAALLAKLLYGALLSVVLLANLLISRQVGTGADEVPPLIGVLLMAGFWWTAFLKRNDVLEWLSVRQDGDGLGTFGTLGSLYFGLRSAKFIGTAAARGGRDIRQRWHDRMGSGDDRAEGLEATAAGALDESATHIGRHRYEEAQRHVGEDRARREAHRSARAQGARQRQLAAQHDEEATRLREVGDHAGAREQLAFAARARTHAATGTAKAAEHEASIDRGAERVAAAREFVEEADRARETGAQFSERQMAALRDGLRADLDRDVLEGGEPVLAHHWRADMSKGEYLRVMTEGSSQQKIATAAKVRESLARDRRLVAAIPDRPDGAPPTHAERREARGQLLRERRATELRAGADRARRRRIEHQRRRRQGLPARWSERL